MITKNYYKSIFKATSFFGLLEVLKIFLKIFTNWFASKLFGVQGVGLIGLIENTVQLLTSLTGLGISFTGVREIASNYQKNENQFQKAIKIVNYFSLFSGVVAAVISVVFSYYLSVLTFDTANKYWWFIILAIYFICNNLVQSKTIFLEATQNLNKLIKINIALSFLNTTTTIFCFYFFGINGIVISMVSISVINFLVFAFTVKQKFSSSIAISSSEIKTEFIKLIKSGAYISVNTVIGLLFFFILRLFFKNESNGEFILGYFHVGTMFLTTYLGLVFIAMNKFFYPKLAQLSDDETGMQQFTNQQFQINTIIITPAILFVFAFGKDLLQLLFSKDFIVVYSILVLGLLSNIFKGFNYTAGFYLLSKNNFKQFFLINLISEFLNISLTIFLFKLIGLYGIGLAVSLNYLLCACYQYYYTKTKYNFKITFANQVYFLFSVLATIVLMILYFYIDFIYFKYISLLLFIVFSILGLIKLDQFIFNNKIKNFFKN